MSDLSSKPRLRVIEPFRSPDGVRAEVHVSKLGGNPIVVIEADTAEGEPAEVLLNIQEAADLRLWLACALSAAEPPDVHYHKLDALVTKIMESYDRAGVSAVVGPILRELDRAIQVVKDYDDLLAKKRASALPPAPPLTWDTFWQRVRESNWNPSPDDLRKILNARIEHGAGHDIPPCTAETKSAGGSDRGLNTGSTPAGGSCIDCGLSKDEHDDPKEFRPATETFDGPYVGCTITGKHTHASGGPCQSEEASRE